MIGALSVLRAAIVGSVCFVAGCLGPPNPLAPKYGGSIGVPHQGRLMNGVPLPQRGEGYVRMRSDDVKWGNPRLVALIKDAARSVSRQRPGSVLLVGDLSQRWGGWSAGHSSHRTGRDVDLLFYALASDGHPIRSPGFEFFGSDGIAYADKKYVRFDLDREWRLVKALLNSNEASVQWLFIAHWLEALLIEWALANGEDPELVWHAENVLLQPADSMAHDDHLHLRIACTPDEAVGGCAGGGPYWPWIPQLPQLPQQTDRELVESIIGDLLPPP